MRPLQIFIRHLELWLSAAGLAVIVLMPSIFVTELPDWWHVAGLTAIAVGLLHGVIFWIVRQRQRWVCEQTLNEVRALLKHSINNPLTSIALQAGMVGDKNPAQVREILAAVDRISQALSTLSDERLTRWRSGSD